MKLGIVVVYLVSSTEEKLLDLHLRQIETQTTVPYSIYASANRLLPQFKAKLVEHPHIRICDMPSTDLRDSQEHSYYLTQLVKAAIQDGATHIVTLHVDSFPIRAGWAEQVAHQLSDAMPLAAVPYGPYTACLFFRRDFYMNQEPRFLLTEDERASPAYQEFSARFKHIHHSGIGYLFKAYVAGLSWYPLAESMVDALGVMYEDVIFHLHGNARLAALAPAPLGINVTRVRPLLRSGRTLVRKMLPKRFRQSLWENFGDTLSEFDKPVLEYTKEQMLNDPKVYFEQLLKEKTVK